MVPTNPPIPPPADWRETIRQTAATVSTLASALYNLIRLFTG